MRSHLKISAAGALLFALLAHGCSSSVYREVYPVLVDGKYDSEFPYRGCSQQLDEIAATILNINCVAYYREYAFPREEGMTLARLAEKPVETRTISSLVFTQTGSGTGTVVSYENKRVSLLTCAHVVLYPDTLIAYHFDRENRPTAAIKTIAFLKRRSIYVATLPEGGELEVLASDRSRDVAILGKRFATEPSTPIRVFQYPFGKAEELEWGTFVYVFGFPSGMKMVTKGIVSSPNKDKSHSFLVDAVSTRGYSGGVALAVRDGVPNFEAVGIVRLVSGTSTNFLVPEPLESGLDYDASYPYTGSVYVERRTAVEYGVTQAISSEVIRDFLLEHEADILRQGFSFPAIFAPTKTL